MPEPGGVSVETRCDLDRITVIFRGRLDSSTYCPVRDRVIAAALDGHDVVVADVSELEAAADSAWTAFASARWHVRTWPGVPIVLVCADPGRRASITRSAITRQVPIYTAPPEPSDITVARRSVLQRARTELQPEVSSLRQARGLVAEWLEEWDRSDLTLAAATLATILIENVLAHTASDPVLVVEADCDTVTVAVTDHSHSRATRRETSKAGAHTVSGLAIVAALSREWGCTPRTDGKTVWALLGPENHL
ncbi:sulfate transporter [Mycolicibacterium vaccae]|uniref:sulfate transporter n=1 Tax=Mycolicibacterium vaccae TaxID=1810 RepID=UPI003CFA1985